MKLSRKNLPRLKDPDFFFWAAGIEDTFITAPWPQTGRTLDEYELTGHYEQWREDLSLLKELGVSQARYGIPWHRINPAPNRWEWDFAEKTLGRLLELGIDPIVDLVHYGLPGWIANAYLEPDFPKYMAEYAGRVAEKFKGSIHLYTPLNEPRITAWYCGKLGWWPPCQKGWNGFLRVMLGVCRGIVETTERLLEIDPEIVPVHVDATDLYESSDPALGPEVERRQEIVFLALDLVSGRVNPDHSLFHWMLRNGITAADLEWFQARPVQLDLIGINLYPLFSQKVLTRSPRLKIKMPYAPPGIVERLARMYFQRYGTPVFISETASLGAIKKRSEWLSSSVDSARFTREQGIPLVGYTWWPLFALVTWAYRQGDFPPAYYLKQMGLWDIAEKPGGHLERVRTSLVDQYKTLVEQGSAPVGRLSGPVMPNRMETLVERT
jgi:beta-glucosidase/6-phospho-beta-glucosidase/beta-galactosidase